MSQCCIDISGVKHEPVSVEDLPHLRAAFATMLSYVNLQSCQHAGRLLFGPFPSLQTLL